MFVFGFLMGILVLFLVEAFVIFIAAVLGSDPKKRTPNYTYKRREPENELYYGTGDAGMAQEEYEP